MLQPNFFNTVLVFPILNVLVAFYKLFLTIKLPGAYGFAIITLTVLVRLLLHPFFKQQLETAKKMQELKPHLDKLSQKHKGDAKKLQEEQMKLYQQAGLNPAAGCIFMIIQIPIFIALYQTLTLLLVNGHKVDIVSQINKVLYSPILKISAIDPVFFGLNLALTPAKGGHWLFYLIPVITAFLQYLQVQVSTPAMTPPPAAPTADKKPSGTDDFQKAMNTQMKYFFPLMIGWFTLNLPIGLALYWNIFSIFSIVQYRRINSK
jgi:YidC/Oxa1 family membrane protein insertase